MAFPVFRGAQPLAPAERRRRRFRLARRLVTLALVLLAIVGALHTWRSVAGRKTTIHVATKPVTVLSATPQGDQVHVVARLDAPSQDAATQQIDALVPASTWSLTKVLWACYPPADPAKGVMRTPLDPDCTHFAPARD